jgi:sulfhydrogenase subunit delta
MINKINKKPALGFFSFTCCEGCQFTILFLDELLALFDKFDICYFHLLKEKNKNKKFNVAFIEGAISSKSEIEKLKKIRSKSEFVVALGACACHGGIPAMKNFLGAKKLSKYVYGQKFLQDSIETQPIENFIKVDYHMFGCPIHKCEFVRFIKAITNINSSKILPIKEPEGNVCGQCPRRGNNCFLKQKEVCLGSFTRGGCDAACTTQGIPCMMCRGPVKKIDFAAEIALFKNWGLEEKDIISKIEMFGKR